MKIEYRQKLEEVEEVVIQSEPLLQKALMVEILQRVKACQDVKVLNLLQSKLADLATTYLPSSQPRKDFFSTEAKDTSQQAQ